MYNLGTFSNKVALNRYLLRKKKIYPPSVFKKLTKYKNFLPETKTMAKNIFQERIFFFWSRSLILKSTPSEEKKKRLIQRTFVLCI